MIIDAPARAAYAPRTRCCPRPGARYVDGPRATSAPDSAVASAAGHAAPGCQPAATVLVADAGPAAEREQLLAAVAAAGLHARVVDTGEAALRALSAGGFAVAVLDLRLPGMSGRAILSAVDALGCSVPVVGVAAPQDAEAALEAVKLGAVDVVLRPLATATLRSALTKALRRHAAQAEAAQRRHAAGDVARRRLVGCAPTMERMLDLITRVAPLRATVLVTGETGTGKELVARAVHDLSPRARKPFVAVNCAALPEALLESELFGHVKGAFTGAIASRRGRFEEASGGTLFLDEISAMAVSVQVKLLRVIQERTIERIGDNQPVPTDFRLVVASNRDLAEEVRAGRFREDLYYRLNVFPIPVPPLRERKTDIPLLAEHFRSRFAAENGTEPPAMSWETLERMMDYDWPGNVRELENFTERALILYAGEATIRFAAPLADPNAGDRGLLERAWERRWDLERLEREYILKVLEETGGRRARTAEALHIDRRTLYRRLRRWHGDAQAAD